ncbi:hypothetical protein OAA77_00920 [Gammaproteobacteria bacterium]|nr:hypothetical protein [Gammaproteobacteria bacterium]
MSTNDIETYFNEGSHVGSLVDGILIYKSRDCSFRLRDELWHTYETKIIKPADIKILSNDTPFTSRQLAVALVDLWFGAENADKKEMANRKARDRRAKQKEVA